MLYRAPRCRPRALQRFGMEVTAAADGAAMRQAVAATAFDVIVLDLMLPDENGLALCRWVQEASAVPVIMLTAQGDPLSRVTGLELGADDYVAKPFEPRELVARIHAVLRRAQKAESAPAPQARQVVRFEGWTFDRLHRQLLSPEQVVIALSAAEYRLLSAFVDHAGRVLGREQLIELTRTPGMEVNDRRARWLARPMRQLVDAAGTLGGSLGHGPGVPQLDEARGTMEVREAARVFNRMASELHEQFRSRGLLMASLSHDLRTPLTCMRMRMRVETVAPPPLAQRCVADIREMDALIETALEVFRNAEVQERARHTDLLALVQSLADDLVEQGQPVTLAGSPVVACIQPVATRRIVANLLGNALRRGMRADVSVHTQGGWACVVIDDAGPGIPEAQLLDVFRPFYRVDGSRSRGTGGTGLGLYIVRDLTLRQGGQIALSNRAGGGLRAELRLPLR